MPDLVVDNTEGLSIGEGLDQRIFLSHRLVQRLFAPESSIVRTMLSSPSIAPIFTTSASTD